MSHLVPPNSIQSLVVYQCLEFRAYSYRFVPLVAKQFVGKMSADGG